MLTLGKSFDRKYEMRVKFLSSFYKIGIFFNRRSTFLLFSADAESDMKDAAKINMFKNIESSRFCETFLELHNYRKQTLDIVNQFKSIRPEYFHEISFLFNETLNLTKYEIDERELFDCLHVYGFTINSYQDEFIFILTERHNIVKKLGRKIVRTSGIQIASSQALKIIQDYHDERLISGKAGTEIPAPTDRIIKLEDE